MQQPYGRGFRNSAIRIHHRYPQRTDAAAEANKERGGILATTGFWPIKGRLKDAIDYAS